MAREHLFSLTTLYIVKTCKRALRAKRRSRCKSFVKDPAAQRRDGVENERGRGRSRNATRTRLHRSSRVRTTARGSPAVSSSEPRNGRTRADAQRRWWSDRCDREARRHRRGSLASFFMEAAISAIDPPSKSVRPVAPANSVSPRRAPQPVFVVSGTAARTEGRSNPSYAPGSR